MGTVNRSLAQPEKGRVTAVDSSPQYSIPISTLAAPSKSDHRQYGGVQDYVFVQHHVAAVLPMIPKDLHDVRTGSRRPRSSNRSLAQPEKGRVTAVDSSPQYSIPNSTLAAPSKSDHRQYGGVQDYVFVQHHVAAVLPMIPKDFASRISKYYP